MLKPKYIEQLPENLIELYSQLEQDILADMARRLSTYDYYIPAAQWQRDKLIELGNFEEWIIKALASRTGMTQEEIKALMEEAGMKALKFDDGIYKAAGLNVPPISASPALLDVINTGIRKTNGMFENLTNTTAGTATKQLENALDRAYMQIVSGAFDKETSVRNAIKDLARHGVGAITYPTGKMDSLETAVRRAVVTGVNQTALKLQEARAEQMGSDLVETTAHAGARPSHAEWQGKVFSLSGKSKKYPDFKSSTGYGTGAGLGGWNCRHSFYPYFEGSPRAYTDNELKGYNSKNVEYNGQKMTEYEASLHQRSIERNIRRWKREKKAMEAAGLPTEEASAKIKSWQEREKDFLKQTGFKKQAGRSQVGNYGKSDAQKTNWENRKSIDKYKEIRYNKDGSIIVTDDRTNEERPSILPVYKPNAVVDTTSRRGAQFDRTIYGENGWIKQQIHWGDHGNAKRHPYGENGEHVHDFTWIPNEKKPEKIVRELTEDEYIAHKNLDRRGNK